MVLSLPRAEPSPGRLTPADRIEKLSSPMEGSTSWENELIARTVRIHFLARVEKGWAARLREPREVSGRELRG